MNKLKVIQKQYQKLSILLISIWKETDFLSHKKDWKNFESNNKSIALNVLHVAYNTEEIRHPFKLKYNKKIK